MYDAGSLNRGNIRGIVEKLPTGLYETYDTIFQRLNSIQIEQAIRALTWLAFANMELTVETLALLAIIKLSPMEAIHEKDEVDYSQPLFEDCDIEGIRIDPLEILRLLPGLLVVGNNRGPNMFPSLRLEATASEKNKVVQLTHFSVYEYLISEVCTEYHEWNASGSGGLFAVLSVSIRSNGHKISHSGSFLVSVNF
jgi:hypothetical protein